MRITKRPVQPTLATYDIVHGRRLYSVYAVTWPEEFRELPQIFVQGNSVTADCNDGGPTAFNEGGAWARIDDDDIACAMMDAGATDGELPVLCDLMIRAAVAVYAATHAKTAIAAREWIAEQLQG